MTATWDDVSRVAATLPGSEQKASGHGHAWFIRKTAYVWESVPWPSEAEHIRAVVGAEPCVGLKLPDEDDKRALLQGWPDVFLASQTSWGGPKIIVRLGAVDPEHLAELVTEAWRVEAPKYLIREFDGDLG